MSLRSNIVDGGNFLKVTFFGKRLPLFVGWMITSRCNMNCEYCNSGKICSRELGTQESFDLIDRLAAAGTRMIRFTGGEPLLRDDIGCLLRHAKSKGLITGLSTNGTLLPARIHEIQGVDLVCLSLDGPEPVHDALRGKGSFGRAMSALEVAVAHGLNVRLSACLSRLNFHETRFILETAKRFAMKASFQPLVNTAQFKGAPLSEPESAEFRKTVLELIEIKKQKNPHLSNSLSGLRYMLK